MAAELTGVGVQTLRLYERDGLITPARSAGGTRRYSHDDLARLHRITKLNGQDIPVTAIGRILELEDANATLAAERDRIRDHAASPRRRPESSPAGRPPRDAGTEVSPSPATHGEGRAISAHDLARYPDNS